jgi:hypothetical protein
LLVLVVYGPVLVLALSEPGTAARLEGINYFADTLLFAGTILALASASPKIRLRVRRAERSEVDSLAPQKIDTVFIAKAPRPQVEA